MSLRIPVTETFNMAWSKPYVTRKPDQSAEVSWKSSNTTMVGSITPWFSITQDNQINQGSGAAHPAINATTTRIAACKCAATNQKLYQTYCNLYDEVKLDGMTVALSILTPVGTTDLPSLSVATAWDRRANGAELRPMLDYYLDAMAGKQELAINNNTLYPPPDAMGQDIDYPMVISTDYINSYAELIAGPNASEATALNNSVAKIFRSQRASDLLERNTFHDGEIERWADSAAYYDKGLYQSTVASEVMRAAPTSPYGFIPVFYFALKRTTAPDAVDQTIAVQAEVNYYFTFRNPKFGGTTFDPISSAVLMNRAISEGQKAIVRAAAQADQEESMDAKRSLRSQLGDYYHIEDDDSGDLVIPETSSEMTESGRSLSSTGNKKKQRVMESDTDMVIPDESTRFGLTSKRMDSKSGMH